MALALSIDKTSGRRREKSRQKVQKVMAAAREFGGEISGPP